MLRPLLMWRHVYDATRYDEAHDAQRERVRDANGACMPGYGAIVPSMLIYMPPAHARERCHIRNSLLSILPPAK